MYNAKLEIPNCCPLVRGLETRQIYDMLEIPLNLTWAIWPRPVSNSANLRKSPVVSGIGIAIPNEHVNKVESLSGYLNFS